MTLIWERAPYTAGSLLVLLALADWANDEGVAWPSMERLAEKARVDKRSAQRIVRQLQRDGVLEIEEGGGRARQHKFFIKMERVTNCHPLKGDTDVTVSEIKGGISDTERVTFQAERVTSDTETVTPMSPDPLEEPSEEPSVKPPPPATRVFERWKETFNHSKSVFDSKRLKAVNARLRDGYSVDDLFAAIEGCARSPHHMGQNQRHEVYDDIELICRDSAHVESFIAKAGKPNGRNGRAPGGLVDDLNLPPLPAGVARWVCVCGFGVLQNGNGIKECPECRKVLTVETQVA